MTKDDIILRLAELFDDYQDIDNLDASSFVDEAGEIMDLVFAAKELTSTKGVMNV